MDISDSPAKGHSFCKIVLSETSCHDKLTIPRRFIRKYGEYLRARVYLKAPRGGVWPVDLVGYDDEVWLQNGWPEFANFYSVSFGHFLVFKYQGNSYFDVFVYNKSGIEIDYPLVNTIINTDEQDNLNTEQSTQVDSLNLHDPLHQDNLNEDGAGSYEGRSTTLASAKAYKSNIPSFVLTVSKSKLTAKSGVDIMRAFAVKYMKRSTPDFEVCLQVEERTWPVRCAVFRNRYRFCKGWSKFAQGNSLAVGDVCVFELINEAPMLLKVFIYRAAEC